MTIKTPYERLKKWREIHPEKIKAHRIVFVGVRNGSIKRKKCFCGKKKVEAHHEDYLKPLDIMWLCHRHHHDRHKVLNTIYIKKTIKKVINR